MTESAEESGWSPLVYIREGTRLLNGLAPSMAKWSYQRPAHVFIIKPYIPLSGTSAISLSCLLLLSSSLWAQEDEQEAPIVRTRQGGYAMSQTNCGSTVCLVCPGPMSDLRCKTEFDDPIMIKSRRNILTGRRPGKGSSGQFILLSYPIDCWHARGRVVTGQWRLDIQHGAHHLDCSNQLFRRVGFLEPRCNLQGRLRYRPNSRRELFTNSM